MLILLDCQAVMDWHSSAL